MSLRTILVAGTIAIAGALSSGSANAAPALDLSLPMATESAAQPAYYPGHGYGYGHRRLCRLPFFVLVRHYGFWRAKMIKRNCYRPHDSY